MINHFQINYVQVVIWYTWMAIDNVGGVFSTASIVTKVVVYSMWYVILGLYEP